MTSEPPNETRSQAKKPSLEQAANLVLDMSYKTPLRAPQRVIRVQAKLLKALSRFDTVMTAEFKTLCKVDTELADPGGAPFRLSMRSVATPIDPDDKNAQTTAARVAALTTAIKHRALAWLDQAQSLPEKTSIDSLRERFDQECQALKLPKLSGKIFKQLVKALQGIERVKGDIPHDISFTIASDHGKPVQLTSERCLPDGFFRKTGIKERIVMPQQELILITEKADRKGSPNWTFKNGDTRLKANIRDREWLQQILNGAVRLRRQDALRCNVNREVYYSPKNEVVWDYVAIDRVLEIIPGDNTN